MTDANGNGHPVEIEKIDQAEAALTRLRLIEIALLIIGAAAFVATAVFLGWAVVEIRGVASQIRSCTTPEGACYQETTVRARTASRGQQEELNRQHRVIECVLLIAPADRDIGDLQICERQHPAKGGP